MHRWTPFSTLLSSNFSWDKFPCVCKYFYRHSHIQYHLTDECGLLLSYSEKCTLYWTSSKCSVNRLNIINTVISATFYGTGSFATESQESAMVSWPEPHGPSAHYYIMYVYKTHFNAALCWHLRSLSRVQPTLLLGLTIHFLCSSHFPYI